MTQTLKTADRYWTIRIIPWLEVSQEIIELGELLSGVAHQTFEVMVQVVDPERYIAVQLLNPRGVIVNWAETR